MAPVHTSPPVSRRSEESRGGLPPGAAGALARLTRVDAGITLAIAAATAVFTLFLFARLDPRLLAWPAGNDVWFEGDLPVVFRNLLDRFSDQTRNGDHPLFPLLATVPVTVLHRLGASDSAAVGVFLAAVAAIWGGLLYTTLRLAELRRLDATLFTVAGASTAAAIFWLPVPECAGLASVTMMAALGAAAVAARGRLHPAVEVAVSALTLSTTVTHWAAGLLLAIVRHPVGRAVQLSVNALALVVILWAVQRVVVPSAEFFIGYTAHAKFVMHPESGGPRHVLTTLLVHSAVMPAPLVRHEAKWGDVMTIQHGGIRADGPVALVARIAWAGLLALGIVGLSHAASTLRWVVLGTLAWQLALHSVYGEESFLYALSTAPMLVVIAAHAARTRARPVALLLAALFIVAAGWTNLARFDDARTFMDRRQGATVTDGP